MTKKYILLLIFLFIVMLFLGLFLKFRNPISIQTVNSEVLKEDNIKDTIIVRCFLNNIYADVKDYYSNPDIEVFDYETKVSSVEDKKNVGILVKFHTTPQIGAHNPVGEDELTYHIQPNGEIMLTDYNHIKSYPLP